MKKLILSAAFVFATFASSAFAMDATVVSAKGKAEFQNGGNSWVALKAGDTLSQGSVIQTGFKSEVVLKIKESTVTVAPLSRITLQSLVEREGLDGAKGKDETAIFLDTGSLKSNVQKSADRRVGFTVRSPVATASVRGTEFDFSTKYKGVNLTTHQGAVAFWKNTRSSEQVLDNAATNPELPAEEAGLGNEPQDISDYAPPSAIVVSRGEGAAAAQGSPSVSAPVAIARTGANSLGDGTRTAASSEAAAHAANAPISGGEPMTGGMPKSNGTSAGSLVVSVEFED